MSFDKSPADGSTCTSCARLPDCCSIATISPIRMPAGAVDSVPPAVCTVEPARTRPCVDESSTKRSTRGSPAPWPLSEPVSRITSSGVVVVVVNSGTPVDSVSGGRVVVVGPTGSSIGSRVPAPGRPWWVRAPSSRSVVWSSCRLARAACPKVGESTCGTVIVGSTGASDSTFAPIENSGSTISSTTDGWAAPG
ncbi:MAG: hypothetical protein R2713_02500 [Ilumatobacteraceae bacterium]